MKTLPIKHLDGQYPCYIGEHLLKNGELLRQHIAGTQVLLVSNETVATLYLAPLKEALQPYQLDTCILPDGEQHKNLNQLSVILDSLAKHHHHRDTTVIALGGGVITDIAGFAAACWHRGVNWIAIPTSLLAQVDAAIGGKTAVNHPLGKNLIGAFHQPTAIIADINTLNSLPTREFNAGLAEIIKAALIADADFFSELEKSLSQLLFRETASLIFAISQACLIKANIVAKDTTEKNIRALLNFGHTFGHAIEQVSGYQGYLHGEAVAIGMVLAANLSNYLGLLAKQNVERIENILKKANLPTQLPGSISSSLLLESMQRDKKVLNDQLRFILLSSIGHGIISDNIALSKVSTLLHNK